MFVKKSLLYVMYPAVIFLLLFNGVADEIIVETHPEGQNVQYYREVDGVWQDSVAKSMAPGLTRNIGSRFSDWREGTVAQAIVTPDFTRSGVYEVYVTWSQSANLKNVKYTVNHADGESNIFSNQDGWGQIGEPNHSKWISLGRFNFSRGRGNSLRVDASEARGAPDERNWPRVYTDGFRFVYRGPSGEADVSERVVEREEPRIAEEPRIVRVDEDRERDEGLNWHRNLQEATRVARRENRRLLVYFYTPQAQGCREYDRYFESSAFQSRLQNYVLVRIDLSQDPQHASDYSIFRVPAIVIKDSRGVETSRISRPLPRQDLLDRL